MALEIRELHFRNFRNYKNLKLDDLGDLVILVGPNGSGKTNILEGVDLLTSASSFRHPMIEQMICDGADCAALKLRGEGEGRVLESELELQKGKKKYSLNGKQKSTADMKGMLPSVTFVPDDLNLAKKSSSIKRETIDDLGCQLTRNYYVVRRDYVKALRYKNKLLKEEAAGLLLDSIDETLTTCATQLCYYRYELFRRMIPLVADNYRKISSSQEEFNATYTPSWVYLGHDDKEGEISFKNKEGVSREFIRMALEQSLVRWRTEEIKRVKALVGPHNDKIGFFLNDRAAADFASQGQQRSIVLAWKMAEVDVIRQSLGTYPVLLLDDVMSELDADRRSLLIELVKQDVQTFITATDLSYFPADIVDKARVIRLPIT